MVTHRVSVKPEPDAKHQRVNFYAAVDGGKRFLVGRGVSFKGRLGLEREGPDESCNYVASDYMGQYGTWALLLDATALCESNRSMVCLNTYDRGGVTFGAFQFSAHVPGGDFVQWFHRLLTMPKAADYFPELALANGHVTLVGPDDLRTQLEDESTTAKLMQYFKPDSGAVTTVEVERAARLAAWTRFQPELPKAQVEVAYDTFRLYAKELAKTLHLDGLPDYLLCVVLDVRHQGRGTIKELGQALRENADHEKALAALLKIGAGEYAGRCDALREDIQAKRRDGLLGKTLFSAAENDFAPTKAGAGPVRGLFGATNMPMTAALDFAPAHPDAGLGHKGETGELSDIDTRVDAFCAEMSTTATSLLKAAAMAATHAQRPGAGRSPVSPVIIFTPGKAPLSGFRTPEQQAYEVAGNHSWVCWGAHMTGKARDIIMRVDGTPSFDPRKVFGRMFGDFTRAWGEAMGKYGLKNWEAGDGWSAGDEFHLELPNARMAVTDDRAKACLTEYVRLTRGVGMHPNAKFEKEYAKLLKPYIDAAEKNDPSRSA